MNTAEPLIPTTQQMRACLQDSSSPIIISPLACSCQWVLRARSENLHSKIHVLLPLNAAKIPCIEINVPLAGRHEHVANMRLNHNVMVLLHQQQKRLAQQTHMLGM